MTWDGKERRSDTGSHDVLLEKLKNLDEKLDSLWDQKNRHYSNILGTLKQHNDILIGDGVRPGLTQVVPDIEELKKVVKDHTKDDDRNFKNIFRAIYIFHGGLAVLLFFSQFANIKDLFQKEEQDQVGNRGYIYQREDTR